MKSESKVSIPHVGQLTVEYWPIDQVKPRSKNPRTHTKRQIRRLAKCIRECGFANPILVDKDGIIIAGHGRLAAALLLGFTHVPVIQLLNLSPEKIRVLVIADNRLSELAGWDKAVLVVELDELARLEIDFDISITGFDDVEIEMLREEHADSKISSAAEEIPEVNSDTPPVSQPGDIWMLRNHRLLCADARDPESYRQLLDGRLAQMVFTDPPYNSVVPGNVSGLGKVQHDDFIMASGEMTEEQFVAFLGAVAENLVLFSTDGAISYICMDWRHAHELLTVCREVYDKFMNLCVWNKSNAGMGAFYRSKHELVFVFKKGTKPHINNFHLGQYGRNRTNVWAYAGMTVPTKERQEQLALHPTVKPVALVADAMKDCSKRNGIILDPFMGSGTTIIAAEVTGRRAYGLELDPRYVDVAIRRWQKQAGEAAVHAGTGVSFDTLAENPRTAQEG